LPRKEVVIDQNDLHHRQPGRDAPGPILVRQLDQHLAQYRFCRRVKPTHQYGHDRLGQRCAAMKIQIPGAIRRHAARDRQLRKVAANADLVSAHHQAVVIGGAIAQHHSVVCGDRPAALRLDADIAGLGLGVEEEAVVSHHHRFLEAHATQLVQRHPDQLERAGNQAERRLRVAFQLAVDLG
jgi:hypothetical protein